MKMDGLSPEKGMGQERVQSLNRKVEDGIIQALIL